MKEEITKLEKILSVKGAIVFESTKDLAIF